MAAFLYRGVAKESPWSLCSRAGELPHSPEPGVVRVIVEPQRA